LDDELVEGLKRYEIGSKIRALRVKKKLGLAQLGEHTGLSPALLSKIERGNLFPTLPTLLRIAMVFGLGLEHFFVETEHRPLMAFSRKQDRLRLPNRPAEETRPISLRASILRCPIANWIFIMQSSLAERSRQRCTSTLARSSFTSSRGT
jgi:transcriptional regulator with XRE-family HTH domain